MAYVQTYSLTKCFGTLTALDQCSLAVHQGEVLGLLGPNGSGKTTLQRLLLGFLRPTAGTATIDSLDCYRQSVDVHARLAYLPGDVRLPRRMRGHDVLQLLSRLRGGSDPRPALALAQQLGLDVSRSVAHASTGMRQKLALAAVLAADVPLLVLDEPTNNLDPAVRNDVLQLLAEAKRTGGRTVIFSSHVLSEVERACDRVVILRNGRVVHTQTMSELRRTHRIRARLAGPMPPLPDPVALPVKIDCQQGQRLTIETTAELSLLLKWLAEVPLAAVQIEPVGLQAVYDRYHTHRTP